MNTRTLLQRPRCAAALTAALLLATAATLLAAPGHAAAVQPQREHEATYQRERAACLDGSSPQDRATCLKEAGAARAEARRSTLDNGESAAQRRRNALARCAAVAPADRSDCERLARGEGQRKGSVAEGAILKQITNRSSGPAPAASAAAADVVPSDAAPSDAPAPQR